MALEKGADGVLIIGCPPGSCHFGNGNVHALKRFTLLNKFLDELGIDSARVHLDWAASGDGEKLLTVFGNMVQVIRAMDPLVRPQ
jgi:coenzyme F420-reducing hydrogenase delta subunit